MPNYVLNKIELTGNINAISAMLGKIQNDVYGKGTIDFMKIIPRSKDLDIEAGSCTYRGIRRIEELMEDYAKANDLDPKSVKYDDISENYITEYRKEHPEVEKDEWNLGEKAIRNREKYGAPTWYEWDIQNWGSKWNACGYCEDTDYSRNTDYLEFETAWSAPIPVIEKLAKDYPDVTFIHRWADEDLGYNCGIIGYENGRQFIPTTPDAYLDDFEFACEVWGYDPEEMKEYY